MLEKFIKPQVSIKNFVIYYANINAWYLKQRCVAYPAVKENIFLSFTISQRKKNFGMKSKSITIANNTFCILQEVYVVPFSFYQNRSISAIMWSIMKRFFRRKFYWFIPPDPDLMLMALCDFMSLNSSSYRFTWI